MTVDKDPCFFLPSYIRSPALISSIMPKILQPKRDRAFLHLWTVLALSTFRKYSLKNTFFLVFQESKGNSTQYDFHKISKMYHFGIKWPLTF